jgi:hypothetical protein
MAKKVTKEQVLEAINNTQGLITKIQRKLIAETGEHWNWETVQKYVHKWPETEAALKAETECVLDFAEQNVNKAIIEDHDLATSKWYLKMKGKERGYIETQEVLNHNEDPIRIDLTGDTMSVEALKESADIEVTGGDSSE